MFAIIIMACTVLADLIISCKLDLHGLVPTKVQHRSLGFSELVNLD